MRVLHSLLLLSIPFVFIHAQLFLEHESLVLAYTFDEAWTDSIPDESGNDIKGYNANGYFTSGRLGGAIEFNEEDTAHIMIGSPEKTNISQFTMWAWVYPYTYGIDKQRMEIAEKTNSYWMNIRNANTVNTGEQGAVRVGCYFSYDETSTNFNGRADSRQTVPLNQWTFICGTFDGSAIKVYINGIVDSIRPVPYTKVRIEKYNLVVGAKHHQLGDSSFVANFNGKIDDFYLFDQSLTDKEIADFYQATALAHSTSKALAGINIFPTPSTGIIHIKSNSSELISVNIYNTAGQPVQSFDFLQSAACDLSHLYNGVYWVQLYTQKGIVATRKIVLQK